MKVIELRPVKENDEDFEPIRKKIVEVFKRELYYPLLKELDIERATIKNSKSAVADALNSGRIQFYRGSFSGRFNSSISRELKSLGAQWDRKTRTWKVPQSSLPIDVRAAISTSEAHFTRRLEKLDAKLSKVLPEEIAGKIKVSDQFDTSLWRTDKKIRSTLKAITVTPELTPSQRKKISDEWQTNMDLWIKDFTATEIKNLRKDIRASVFSGNRRESMVKAIQKSYDVTENKAKFLASQESRLLLTKFKETRYVDAGVSEYKWGCVHMPHQPSPKAPATVGEVRYYHGILEGQIFSWNNPPRVNAKGDRKNPGQDYNCRCFAIPVVRFK